MVASGIFTAYRKLKEMNFTKEESRKIIKQNTNCLEKLTDTYDFLNDTLQKIDYTKYTKTELIKEIKEQTYLSKVTAQLNNTQIWPDDITGYY